MRIALILFIAFFSFFSVQARDRIVFTSRKGDIYIADIDAGNNIRNIRNITNHPAVDYHPVWSPDGRRIAFISDRDGFSTIYIMDSSGRNPRPLNRRIREAGDPNWYPDGRKILVEGKSPEGKRYLFIVNTDGKILDEISLELSPLVTTYGFKLSPDGKYIVCHDIRNHNISIIDTDTWELKGITGRDEWGSFMDWLKEDVILFARLEGGKMHMVLLTLDGRVIQKYALPRFIFVNSPACSPDGKRIIFEGSQKKGEWFLYVLDLNNGRVENTGVKGGRPDWWGYPTPVKPLNLLNTLWSLIKRGEVKR